MAEGAARLSRNRDIGSVPLPKFDDMRACRSDNICVEAGTAAHQHIGGCTAVALNAHKLGDSAFLAAELK
jgi:hypothetical protein